MYVGGGGRGRRNTPSNVMSVPKGLVLIGDIVLILRKLTVITWKLAGICSFNN